jgi:hypothetical protein
MDRKKQDRAIDIQRQKDAISLSEKQLSSGNYRQAALAMADYESKCVRQRGLNTSWDNYNPSNDEVKLRYIFTKTPQALINSGWNITDKTRIAAGLIQLWGSPAKAGLTCDEVVISAARLLVSHAHYLSVLDDYRQNKFTDKSTIVRVYTCNDQFVCPACRKIASREKFRLDEVPEFPIAECTNKNGCRCWIG